ncbi:cation/multidrug efflux membrane fusion protein, AcrA family [Psychroflexus torquis ATCC 700755]|uniref:Cation/multidrug efflux membrane fusion protein, AcrA family n=1 Tax=Psychroflexus torquis (strain ATCC 700755 / CIP 106069 / ACAM 623) TaxID=313595 RepID=K4IJA2_PSYTT|nr:efflux RND transporter periplasmic adaptor subunit [Psychroflexus torquis]AFU69181.1 cation/multidrug efflux membrane fusion protein, AcrA family [Psychroflexus torquis ATCC 700755]
MKYLSYLTILSLLISVSCGPKEKSIEDIVENGSKAELNQKREELNTSMRKLNSQIKTLDKKLVEFEDSSKYALVEALSLAPKDFNHYVTVQGDVTTDQNIMIYPQFSGVLKDIYVKEGDQVKKGQKLAKIDDGGQSSQLKEMKAQRELSKTRFERQERLWDENIGSEIQYLEAKTAFEQIDNAVDQMKSQLNKSVIYAPFSGKIDEIITDQGQVVSPGQTPIFRILNLGDMYVSANVPENYVGNIREGSEAIVTLGAIGKSFVGKVSQVSSNISESNRNFRVRVSIPDSIDFVKPNLIATLKLNDYTSKQAIVIPENILQENASGQSFTFSLQMENDSIGIANFQELKLGKNYQGEIEVLEGLKSTDIVVAEGARTIKKNDKVRVLNFQKK